MEDSFKFLRPFQNVRTLLAPLLLILFRETLKMGHFFIVHFQPYFPPSFAYEVEILVLALHNFSTQNENKNLLDITFEFLGTYMDFKIKFIEFLFSTTYLHNCLLRK